MNETADEMLLRWRRVAENDASVEKRASYWLGIILKDPNKANVSLLLSWVRESPENALQFCSLLKEIKDLATSFGITLRNLQWLVHFEEEADLGAGKASVISEAAAAGPGRSA